MCAATAVGVALLSPGAVLAGGGGTPSTPTPVVSSVQCHSSCTGLDAASQGSVVRVSGRHLDGVAHVTFLGGSGARDDVDARPRRVGERQLDVVVPRGAHTGPIDVSTDAGATSAPSPTGLTIAARRVSSSPHPVAGSAVDAQIESRTVFYGGRHRARLTYLLKGSASQPVRIDLIRVTTGAVVARWLRAGVSPGTPQSVTWKGGRGSGRYQFQVFTGSAASLAPPAGGGAQAAQDTSPAAADTFVFLNHIFPIRGHHGYGTSIDRFGAPRSGHTHQGQDVLAACGTPLVAARGGVVKYRAFQSAAGNYVVIDGAGTGLDYVYMHLRAPAIVTKGQHVYTGQPIGDVGDTGDAQGCHLHFELWGAPGWYSGGRAFDPLPALKSWDRAS